MKPNLKTNLIFRPSSAHRWFNCPGSVALESQVPDTESSMYALEGSGAHELCRYFAMLSTTESKIASCIGMQVGELIPTKAFDPNDFTYPEDIGKIREILIDPEMAAAVWKYCKYVYDLLDGTSPLNRDVVRFEEKVFLANSKDYTHQGTGDCLLFDWPTELHVIDFKYGAGISVDAYENKQLLNYGIGALNIEDDFEKVTFHIVQPRDKHGEFYKTWSVTKEELDSLWIPRLSKAVSNCISKQTTYRIGDWCRWCKGASAGICPKQSETAQKLVKTSGKAKVPTEVKKLSGLLQSEKAVLEYFNRAKMEAFNRLQRGEAVPGYKLVQSQGNTTWIDAKKVEKIALTYGDADFIYNMKLKTPNQLKRSLEENEFDTDWVDKVTHRPSKGLVLVPTSDKRTEYKTAQQDFEDE